MALENETEPEPDFSQMADQIQASNKQILHYARLRLLWTWLAVGVLAILTSIALLLAIRNANTDLEQTDDIAKVANATAEKANQDTDDITAYLRGEQGIPGVPGADGKTGQPGLPSSEAGSSGPKGDKGDSGTAGPAGATGPAGPAGPMGTAGTSTDTAGVIGPAGPAGPSGRTGEAGERGEPGPQGDSGDQGAKGDKGDIGPQGPEGDAGAAGAAGPAGAQGPPGVSPSLNTTIATAVSANDPNEPKQVTAQCASGRVSGGGYAIVPSDPGIIVTASAPNLNGWNATVEELSLPAATNWQLLVFAVCVS